MSKAVLFDMDGVLIDSEGLMLKAAAESMHAFGIEAVPEDFIPRVHIDVPMPLCVGNETLAEELELLEPFGVGNPKPLFAQRDLLFLSCTRMGTNKNFAKFRVQTPQRTVHQVVYFGDMEKFDAFFVGKYGEEGLRALYRGQGNFTVSMVYQLSRNLYRGRTEVQYVMQNYC